MQQGRIVPRLMIICMTLIALMWITRGSLCDTEVAAILAYGSKG
ncbi:small toxic polypeptide [Serratia proteamaculans]|nr:Hok/Gef family protein [Serratia proteamaculans]KAB1493421.1 Hok/Gef family protein [Serratia proteamaculans]CAI1012917.1 small toxic polypeptide [Serratia proteamaculans]CAI1185086.1 small toxic polypeptide [Serratia proteamaculans]